MRTTTREKSVSSKKNARQLSGKCASDCAPSQSQKRRLRFRSRVSISGWILQYLFARARKSCNAEHGKGVRDCNGAPRVINDIPKSEFTTY